MSSPDDRKEEELDLEKLWKAIELLRDVRSTVSVSANNPAIPLWTQKLRRELVKRIDDFLDVAD